MAARRAVAAASRTPLRNTATIPKVDGSQDADQAPLSSVYPPLPVNGSGTSPVAQLFASGISTLDAERRGLHLVANQPHPDDAEQGRHPDCFFVAAVIAVTHARPDLIKELLCGAEDGDVSVGERVAASGIASDGEGRRRQFAVRLHSVEADSGWIDITVDDAVPVEPLHDGQGTVAPLFIRSPTKKWWPVILEKAYAARYSGSHAIAGGNLVEALFDLTGHPVDNILFDPAASVTTGAESASLRLKSRAPGGSASDSATLVPMAAWKSLADSIRQRSVAITAGTRAAFSKDVGLQPAHAYAVMAIVPECRAIVLRNPNSSKSYVGPRVSIPSALKCQWPFTEMPSVLGDVTGSGKGGRDDLFAMSWELFQELFAGMQVAHLGWPKRSQEDEATNAAFRHVPVARLPTFRNVPFRQGGAEVNPSVVSTLNYPKQSLFLLKNDHASLPATVWLTVSHHDRRCDASETNAISYPPIAVVYLRHHGGSSLSGVGRNPSAPYLMPECADAMSPNAFDPVSATDSISDPNEAVGGGNRPPRFWNRRDVACRVVVPAGATIVAAPSTFDPAFTGDFHLSGWSSLSVVTLAPLPSLSRPLASEFPASEHLKSVTHDGAFSFATSTLETVARQTVLLAVPAGGHTARQKISVILSQPTLPEPRSAPTTANHRDPSRSTVIRQYAKGACHISMMIHDAANVARDGPGSTASPPADGTARVKKGGCLGDTKAACNYTQITLDIPLLPSGPGRAPPTHLLVEVAAGLAGGRNTAAPNGRSGAPFQLRAVWETAEDSAVTTSAVSVGWTTHFDVVGRDDEQRSGAPATSSPSSLAAAAGPTQRTRQPSSGTRPSVGSRGGVAHPPARVISAGGPARTVAPAGRRPVVNGASVVVNLYSNLE